MNETKFINLLTIQEGLWGLDDVQIEERGENLYRELFLQTEFSGTTTLHDEQIATFSITRFNHAFYKSPRKQEIDKRRVARIRWIIPLVQGKVQNSELWLVRDEGVLKRLYICYGLNYVVWLEPTQVADKWVFSTAYVADRKQIKKYQSKGQRIAVFGFKK